MAPIYVDLRPDTFHRVNVNFCFLLIYYRVSLVAQSIKNAGDLGSIPAAPSPVDLKDRDCFPRGAGGRGRTSQQQKAGMHMRRGRERRGAARCGSRELELSSW